MYKLRSQVNLNKATFYFWIDRLLIRTESKGKLNTSEKIVYNLKIHFYPKQNPIKQ